MDRPDDRPTLPLPDAAEAKILADLSPSYRPSMASAYAPFLLSPASCQFHRSCCERAVSWQAASLAQAGWKLPVRTRGMEIRDRATGMGQSAFLTVV